MEVTEAEWNNTPSVTTWTMQTVKLEYLAVYGCTSMGNYYGCAFCILTVYPLLLTHGQKFDPESLYELI